MKVQLDTVAKVIRLEETVNLKDLYMLLEKILPNKEWKEYSLEPNSQMVWQNPITIQPYIQSPYYPWWYAGTNRPEPTITTSTGIYNLQVES